MGAIPREIKNAARSTRVLDSSAVAAKLHIAMRPGKCGTALMLFSVRKRRLGKHGSDTLAKVS